MTRALQLPLQRFLHTESVSGGLLVVAAAIGVVWANSPWAAAYEALWHLPVRAALPPWGFERDLRHLVNDGLMAIFFFVVGLEIKRELVEGALAGWRRAAFPIVAAVGGMVVPAGTYMLIVGSGSGASGWGIPMATDIAFAVAVLSLTPAPRELKVLLLALAIVDDIGAIFVIAIFYTSTFSWAAGGLAAVSVLLVLGMQRAGFQHIGFYAPVALLLWVAVLESGVHATFAGVILGTLTPVRAAVSPRRLASRIRDLSAELSKAIESADGERMEMLAAQVEEFGRQSESPLDRAQRLFHPWSSYVILPLFALANSGVVLSSSALHAAVQSHVSYGVLAGLLVGKPLGILVFGWGAERLHLASLPARLRWRDVAVIGVLGGIGFTVSIFITELAFGGDDSLATAAKIGIFAASILAAIAGWLMARATVGRRAAS